MGMTGLIVVGVVAFLFILFLIGVSRPTAAEKKELADWYEPGKNEVIAFDGYATLLVRAKSFWNITGGSGYELPASVEQVRRGLYKVGFHGYWNYRGLVHAKFYKATGRVIPRKKTDALNELMLGWEHQYATVKLLEKIPPPPKSEDDGYEFCRYMDVS